MSIETVFVEVDGGLIVYHNYPMADVTSIYLFNWTSILCIR